MSTHLTHHDIDAIGDDEYRFQAELPAGRIVFAEIHSGFKHNKLALAIESKHGMKSDLVTREFLFLAEDGVVPDGAQFIAAHQPRFVDGAWVIYELTNRDVA